MKTLRNIILIVLCSVACDRNVEPFTPCMSFTAPWPLEWAQQTWACMNMPRPEDSYNYPIGLGLEESKVFQIPPCVLEKMSTQAVIQAIWELPQFVGLLDGDRYQTNFDALFSNHHVYVELTKRKDAATAFLERLELVDPLSQMSRALEILMSQSVFLSQLNDDKKKAVVAACVRNDVQRLSNGALTGDRATALFLSGRIMLVAGFLPFVEAVGDNVYLEEFLQGSGTNTANLSYDILALMLDHSQNFSGECWNPSAPEPSERVKETWIGMNFPRPADSYNFPVYLGIPFYDSYNVPSCVLEKMSTQAVVQAIWEHHGITTSPSTANYLRKIDVMMDWNSCRELITREDAGVSLYERLVLVDPADGYLTEKRTIVFHAFISIPVFISQLSSEQKRKLVEIILEQHSHHFPECGYCYMPICRMMYSDGYAPFVEAVDGDDYLKWLLDGYKIIDGYFYDYFSYIKYNIPQEVFSFIEDYLNQQ